MKIPFARATALVAFALGGVTMVIAPTVRADEPARCSTLLTPAELKAAVGQEFGEASEPVSHGQGHSECSFFEQAGEAAKSVTLSFSDLDAIRDGLVSANSVAEFFDVNVSSTERVSGEKGQKLSGIGVRAMLFKSAEPARIYVETKDGFAAISASGLTPEQLTAVASAVVSP